MNSKENKIRKFNIYLGIFIIMLLVLFMNFNVVFAQESHETGLTNGNSNITDHPADLNQNTVNTNIIKFEVPKEAHISISLFDEYGNLVKLLLYDNIQPGIYEYNLTNQLPGGNYVCKLISGDISESKEVVLK